MSAHVSTAPVPFRAGARHAALGAFAFFVLAVLVAGAITPGYSHVEEHISALAAADAPHAWAGMAAIAALGAAIVATALALRSRVAGRAAVTLLLLAGAGVLVAAAAQSDCSSALDACQALERDGRLSGSHVLHDAVSGLAFLSVVASLFLFARALRRTPELRHLATPTRVVAGLSVVLLGVFVSGAAEPAAGLVQRAFILLAFGWPLLLATRAARRQP